MKIHHLYWILTGLIIMISACNQTPKETMETKNTDENPSVFNAELAQKLGADEYGMKRYVMAFLKAGPNRDMDAEEAAEIQRGHMNHINRLVEEKKMVMAGPFLDGGELRGIFIFDVETIEEARLLTEADPAVESGRLVMELHPWYGSAALSELVQIHESIAQKSP